MERHCENAEKVASYLEASIHVESINYPQLASDPQHHRAKKYLSKGSSGVITFQSKEEKKKPSVLWIA